MAEDVTQAVREQLATWLRAQLQSTFPMLVVQQEWPAAGPLVSDYVITVLAQDDADYRFHTPAVVSVVPGAAPNGSVTYSFGRVDSMPLVLDCFATSQAGRDALARELRKQLSVHPAVSLGGGDPFPRLGRYPNLSLALSGLYGAVYTYRFSPISTPQEDSSSTQKSDYRATFRGNAAGPLLEQDPSFPLMKRLFLRFKTTPDNIVLQKQVQGGAAAPTGEGLLGVVPMRRVIVQPDDGMDFRVTLPTAQPNDRYELIPAIVKNSAFVGIECPDSLSGDRTTTDFRCVTDAPLDNGAIVSIIIVPSL